MFFSPLPVLKTNSKYVISFPGNVLVLHYIQGQSTLTAGIKVPLLILPIRLLLSEHFIYHSCHVVLDSYAFKWPVRHLHSTPGV